MSQGFGLGSGPDLRALAEMEVGPWWDPGTVGHWRRRHLSEKQFFHRPKKDWAGDAHGLKQMEAATVAVKVSCESWQIWQEVVQLPVSQQPVPRRSVKEIISVSFKPLMRGGHGGFGESQSFGESLGISGRLCSRSRSLTRNTSYIYMYVFSWLLI